MKILKILWRIWECLAIGFTVYIVSMYQLVFIWPQYYRAILFFSLGLGFVMAVFTGKLMHEESKKVGSDNG